MLGELVGQGELRRSIGMVSLISVLSPFPFSFASWLVSQGLTQAGSLYEKKRHRGRLLFFICAADSCFPLLFVYQNQETGQIALSSQFQSFVL